ncbi:hypothetical protein H632_c5502p0 [Helicosporidium sp. ATCC 50920]|nr:hypothetical protein H632_c5502p0 [Helicosporidium sp. ATCC 50920]|eukprot:KDD71232.1 hypothetical protein H632_c5502p0 [Helicosporidium sp. ATCC 50920]
MHNRQNETSCAWHLTRALWEPQQAHPKPITSSMLTQQGLVQLRGDACRVGDAHRKRRDAGEALDRFLKSWETQANTLSAHAPDHEVERASLRAVLQSAYESMDTTECAVLARKLQPDAGDAWLAMLMQEA